MIIRVLNISKSEDYSELGKIIPPEYISEPLINLFKTRLSSSVKSIAIEYPYVDKDYRSTYYNFYSKRNLAYSRFCFRLHLFESPFDSKNTPKDVPEGYLGSMVLRPTGVTPLGRTLLSPRAFLDFKGYLCEGRFENNLLGMPISVDCFPHITQDTDVTVCAHVVCWMIARYYSEKYAMYPERLLFDIALSTKDFSAGRIIPSRGLSLGQISEILTNIGFYPEVFVRELYDDDSLFYDILYCYVESGIPVLAALKRKQHAIAVLGHGPLINSDPILEAERGGLVTGRAMIDRFIINDDNSLPYESLYFEGNEKGNNGPHVLDDVDGFVVPLYEKMYLNAENVLKLYGNIFQLLTIPIDKRKFIVRVFMTSSRSYKKKIRLSKKIDATLLQAQLELPLPKFIWIIEIASPENYGRNRADYRWIVDATANQYERYPFILIHDSDKMLIYDRSLKGQIFKVFFKSPVQAYEMYENNLRGYI